MFEVSSSSNTSNTIQSSLIPQLKQVDTLSIEIKQELINDQHSEDIQINELNKNGKRDFKQRIKERKLKKQKIAKRPVYHEGLQPAQVLNEIHPGLLFTFDLDTSIPTKIRFICNVEIHTIDEATKEPKTFNFSGDGLSKKDAKKYCCNQALIYLYGDTYKPPFNILHKNDEIDEEKKTNFNRITELKKRMAKIVNKSTIFVKAPSQILNELSMKIAETGKIIQENGQIPEQKFCYQIDNLPDEAIVKLDQSEPCTLNSYGFGKCKKEAKNQASRQALKQFFGCDLDKIANSELNKVQVSDASQMNQIENVPANQIA